MPTIDRFLAEQQPVVESRPRRLRDVPSQIKEVSSMRPQRRAEGARSREFNARRWVGMILIVFSLFGGYFTVMKADRRISVVALAHDLAAGQVIESSDLTQIKAAVPQALYAKTKGQLVGRSLSTSGSSGELVALSHIASPQPDPQVAIPIKSINLPSLTRGDRVALWASGQLVANELIVDAVTQEASHRILTLNVPQEVVSSVVASLTTDVTVVKLP